MIFLIEYDRPEGRIVTFETFDHSERWKAAQRRLEIELDLHRRRIDHEVVLLEASSEEALRQTHRRYFESPREVVESIDRGNRTG